MARIQIVRCDKCSKQIADGEYHIDAGVYGIDLHLTCLVAMNVFEVLRILSLDDIKFGVQGNSPVDYEKLIYSDRAKKIITSTIKTLPVAGAAE